MNSHEKTRTILFCTRCLDPENGGNYRYLKTLSIQIKRERRRTWKKSGFKWCDNINSDGCGNVVVLDSMYTELRASGNHIIKKMSSQSE